jgi:TolA-binding protein
MKRRLAMVPTLAALLLLLPVVSPVSALDEAGRLFMVGERALADGFYPVARRTLERFVAQYPGDARQPQALLMLGKARLKLDEREGALEALQRAQSGLSAPAEIQDAKFWQAEALFRLKRFSEARALYDDVLRVDAAGPLAPHALYGVGSCDLEGGQFESAVTAFRQLLATWPDHAQAAAATVQLARALVESRHVNEALPLLNTFATKYPGSKWIPDAQYLQGWVKYHNGDPRGGLADLRAFVAANPNHVQAPAARRLIAQALGKYGDREEMLAAYKTLIDQEPATAEALSQAADLAKQLGRPKDQEVAWRKLHGQFPDHPLTRKLALELANTAFSKQNWKDASTFGQVAAQSDDSAVRVEGLLKVGESELKLGRFSQAAKAFQAVGSIGDIGADPRYRALAGLGLAHEQQKEWKAALTAYETVANKSPDTTLRDWARARVTAVKNQMPKSNGSPAPKRPEQGKKS